MDSSVAEAAARVGSTREQLSRALATYVRSIRSGNSAYDRYVNGDRGSLAADAQAVLQIFLGKGNCTACHVGPTFSDERFHNTGIAWVARGAGVEAPLDEGRAGVTISRKVGLLKASLDEVVEYFDRGANKNPTLDPEVRPLALTQSDKQALVAFLRSLSGEVMK